MDIQTDMEAATEYKQRKRIRMLLRIHTHINVNERKRMCTPMTAQIHQISHLTIQRAANLEAMLNNVT